MQMNIINKLAIFTDTENNEQRAYIRIIDGMSISINTFDSNNNATGYMNIYFHPNNRLYLDNIYCYDQFRNKGIATFISELSDYILKDYDGYIIRGSYEPGQLSTDRENNIERSQEELEKAARKFYKKNGYEIINYEEYNKNKDKFPYIIDGDFYLGEADPATIVVKQLHEYEYTFYEEDGILYHNKYDRSYTKKINRH